MTYRSKEELNIIAYNQHECLLCEKETNMNFNNLNDEYFCDECSHSYGADGKCADYKEYLENKMKQQQYIKTLIGKELHRSLVEQKLELSSGKFYKGKNFVKEKEIIQPSLTEMKRQYEVYLTEQKSEQMKVELDEKYSSVNNPSHYADTKFETIDIIKDKLSKEQFEGFLVGNVYKYITRYKKKNGIEDLRKAEWYLDYLIGEHEDV